MLMVVLTALFGAPRANLAAQLTILKCIRALPCHRSNALFANVNALNATFRAIIHALTAGHFVEAFVAGQNTFLTGIDTAIKRLYDQLLAIGTVDFLSFRIGLNFVRLR